MHKKLLLIALLIFTQSFIILAQKPGPIYAIDLDGKDDYLLIPDNTALNPTGKITVEAWIKADVFTTASTNPTGWSNSILCKHGWGSGQKGYTLRCGDNGKLNFNIANAAGVWVEAASAAVMKTGIWYHVVGLFNGDSVSVYINGNLEATTPYSGTISPSTGLDAKIGNLAYTAGGNRLFDGQIDEVRVWNTALSKATLRDWMCRKVTKSHPNYSNLAGYWKLDEGTGTDIKDQSQYSNTGTLNNGAAWVNSGASLGDSSVYVYGGTGMRINSIYGDVFSVRNIKGSPGTVHAFVNYGLTAQTPGFNVIGSMDSSHYFGVYYADNTSVNFDMSFNFKNYSKITPANKCKVNMFSKSLGNTGSWEYLASKFYDPGDSLIIKKETNKEFIMALHSPDTNKILNNPSGVNWFCSGDSLILLAADNDSFGYTWYKNGSVLNGKTKKSLWVSSAGNYKVKLTRSASCSFTSPSISISSRSTNVSWIYSLSTCQNSDSVILSAGTPSGGYYNGKSVTSNGYFHPKLAGAGKHTLFYNFIDTNNCINRASNIVTLFDTVKLSQTPVPDACFGSADINLNNVLPVGGTYQGMAVTANKFSIVSAGIGTHPINYIYTHSNACKSKASFSIRINKPDSISVRIKDMVCKYHDPLKIEIYPPGGALKSGSVIGQTFYPLFAGPGLHWIYYTITDSHKCEVKDSAKIYIADITKATISKFVSVCDNVPDFKLSGGQPADSGKYWVNGILSDKFSPSSKGKGVYKIEYKIVNYFGCRDSANTNLRVNASPVKPVISTSGNTLSSNSASGNQWLDKNGPIAGAVQQNYKPTVDGYYFVKVTNDSNCSQISDSVQFKKVGVHNTLKSTVFIYPNPSASGVFHMEGLAGASEIRVTDVIGKVLIQRIEAGSKATIDLGNYGDGVYFVCVKSQGIWVNYKVTVL